LQSPQICGGLIRLATAESKEEGGEIRQGDIIRTCCQHNVYSVPSFVDVWTNTHAESASLGFVAQ